MTDRSTVKEKIASFVKRPAAELADEALLAELVTESFVLVELVIELQETFGARLGQEDLERVKTVGDLAQLVAERGHEGP